MTLTYLEFFYHDGKLTFCGQFNHKILKTCKVILAYLEKKPHLRSKVLLLVTGMVEWVKVLSEVKE